MLESNFSLKEILEELINKDYQIQALNGMLFDQEEQFNKDRSKCWWNGFIFAGVLVGWGVWLYRIFKKAKEEDNFKEFSPEED